MGRGFGPRCVLPFNIALGAIVTPSHFHDDKFHWHSSFETFGSNVKTQTKKLVFRSYLMLSIALTLYLSPAFCFLSDIDSVSHFRLCL